MIESVIGGNIILDDNPTLKYLVVGFIIIIVLYSIYRVYKRSNAMSPQEQARQYFNLTNGEADDENTARAIDAGEQLADPGAIDHYRLGTIYLLNRDNTHRAHHHFNQALGQIRNNQVDIRDGLFILDGIDEYMGRFMDHTDLDDLPLQQALLTQYNNMNTVINDVARRRPEIKSDDPEFVQKVLVNRQHWSSNSQNVHDSALYGELKHQLRQVQAENETLEDTGIHNYQEASNWVLMRFKDDAPKYQKAKKVFNILKNNYLIGGTNIREQEIIEAVWRRAYDPSNKSNINEIKQALADAVLDCVEGTTVVCLTGRTAKIWQSLARIDKDPTIGVLRSKQAMRNEIYERAAKIVDNYVGKSGSVSDGLKLAYQNAEKTGQVEELIETMRREIGELSASYEGRLDDKQLALIISECQAVV